MESTPIYTSGDQEDGFGTKKKRKGLFESAPDDDALSLGKTRHIAREALRHEEAKKPAPIFAISESLLSKPKENSPETETSDEVEDLDKAEMQYAAQALRRETRQQRSEASLGNDEPAVIVAGDLLVDEWDDRIEAGQDVDEALADILQEHDIPAELLDETPESEAEPDWQSEAPASPPIAAKETEYPSDFGRSEVVINTHEEPAEQPLDNDEEIASEFSTESVQPATATPNKANKPPATEHGKDDAPSTSLISNITDYFIGRRGSDNMREKKLTPAKKKLEERVDDLAWELKAKEAKIRQVAAEHVQRKGPSVLETMIAESTRAEQTLSARADAVETGVSNPYIANLAKEYRHRAPEANQLHGAGLSAHEHIGHVLMNAESAKRDSQAPKAERAKEKIHLPPNKRIETLSRPELLAMSEQIAVEGSTLRNVYETHLIGEQALRRLVAEYMHDGDVAKALQREIVEHEIDFERDPALRDLATPGESDDDARESKKVTAPGKEALNQLLQKAEAGIDAGSDEDFIYDKTEPKSTIKRPEPKSPGRKPADTVMGAIIIMLIFLVAVLYLWHR